MSSFEPIYPTQGMLRSEASSDGGGGGSRVRRMGAYSTMHASARLGEHVEVGDHVLVDQAVEIGSRVTIQAGAKLCAGLVVADDVVIGANAVLAADSPTQDDHTDGSFVTRVGRGVHVGANAVILRGRSIGDRARVEPGAVVDVNVPHDAIVAGNPARIVGYVDTPIACLLFKQSSVQGPAQLLRVRGASLVAIPQVKDLRGVTSFGEIGKQLPFVAKRFFFVADVPGREVRGEHAHKTLHEFLVCMKGALSVMLDDGSAREEVRLDSPTLGLHVPPQVWRVVYKYTSDALLLSLCSHEYDPADYIRDYGDFVAYVSAGR
jgi:UDP-2-acetamido-3-amino-2,3-dideoxy-glucuronate N-acetyltransferase